MSDKPPDQQRIKQEGIITRKGSILSSLQQEKALANESLAACTVKRKPTGSVKPPRQKCYSFPMQLFSL